MKSKHLSGAAFSAAGLVGVQAHEDLRLESGRLRRGRLYLLFLFVCNGKNKLPKHRRARKMKLRLGAARERVIFFEAKRERRRCDLARGVGEAVALLLLLRLAFRRLLDEGTRVE